MTQEQKSKIAHNLINVLKVDESLADDTRTFICNWVLTGPNEKKKAFYDVWEIVLDNFMPTSKPVLFRACYRLSRSNKIASFTGRIESARRFSEGKGYLIVYDTKENLHSEETFYSSGIYQNTFFPLVDVLKKAKEEGGYGFSSNFLDQYLSEEEYILRINLDRMHTLKWKK